ncbi:hypothetical protein IQ259_18485 [Fortiea sp. LEGE XX443]|uniref:hypothetical protein n=1 Tax=Fortiea sp. LEGE XX443 TaxID=1828611 RepID=UPI001882094D|nr:hypothetical protein [Fortiea sp. LEGE XX443]MBE9007000.1 hypothetical protein [Fortiea sp. LEGE XX443]
MFKISNILKSYLVLGLSVFSGYLIITGQTETGLVGMGNVIALASMKDDSSEEMKEVQKKLEKSQEEKLDTTIKLVKLEEERKYLQVIHKKELEFQKEKSELELFSFKKQIQFLPEGNTPLMNNQTDTHQTDDETGMNS